MIKTIHRTAKGLFVQILLALLILSFAVWGIGDMLRGPQGNSPVATVGSQKITMNAFAQKLYSEAETMRRMLGSRYSVEMVKNMQLPDYVLQQMIAAELLRQHALDMELVPSDTIIANHITKDINFFDTSGKFSKAIFQQFLQQTKMTERDYVEQIRKQEATDLITTVLNRGVDVPHAVVNGLYKVQNQKRTAELFIIDATSLNSKPKPSQDDIHAYYQSSAEFNIPEQRIVSYISFADAQVAKNITVMDADIQAEYNARKEEFSSYDVAKPLLEKELRQRQVDDQLTAFANKIDDAVAGGATLAEVAKEHGLALKTVPAFTQSGQSLSGEPVKELPVLDRFVDIAFATDEASESPLTHSKGSYYMLRVEKITPQSKKPLESVLAAATAGAQKKLTYDAVAAHAKAFAQAMRGDKAAQAPASFKARVTTINDLTRTTQKNELQDIPDALREELFARKVGEATGAYRSKDGSYMAARLEKIVPAHTDADKKVLAPLRGELQAQLPREISGQYLSYLATQHKVEIHEDALRAAEDHALKN